MGKSGMGEQFEPSEAEHELAVSERGVEEENQRQADFGDPEKRRQQVGLGREGDGDPLRAGRDHAKTNSEPFAAPDDKPK